jgi:hypothetical protein
MVFERITVDADQMGGVPCIRGMRIPVATILGMVADGMTTEEILPTYRISRPRTSGSPPLRRRGRAGARAAATAWSMRSWSTSAYRRTLRRRRPRQATMSSTFASWDAPGQRP